MLPHIPIMTINMNHNNNARIVREDTDWIELSDGRQEEAPPPYENLSDWDD